MPRIARLALASLFLVGCVVDGDDVPPMRSVHDGGAIDDLALLEPGPCTPGTDHWGCPGLPCAHGHCWLGECVGAVAYDDGQTVDPGVCCSDDDCDAD